MSFYHTIKQMRAFTKDLTRRDDDTWKNLKAEQIIMAIEKGQGLRFGEKQVELYPIRILSVRREPLNVITASDVVREGFPDWTPAQFIDFYVSTKKGRFPNMIIKRIEFEPWLIGERGNFLGIKIHKCK